MEKAASAVRNQPATRSLKSNEPAPRDGRRRRISDLLEQIEEKLDVTKMRVTLADFIRLTQLERELEQDEQPREIIVTWKEPTERSAG